MSDISKINPNNGMNVYDLKDSVCRDALTVNDPTEGSGVITFGVDSNGNYGYKKVGADTVIPFKSDGSEIQLLTTISNNTSGTVTVDCSSLTDYSSKTSNDFILEMVEIEQYFNLNDATKTRTATSHLFKNYNSSVGSLTISGLLTGVSNTNYTVKAYIKTFNIYVK